MHEEVHPVVTIRLKHSSIVCDEQLSVLLHLVDETGSIQDSCQRMGISLPSAWYLLAQAEDSLGVPLLRHHQGRSFLTEKGRNLMDGYDGFRAAVQEKADAHFASFLHTDEPSL